MTRDIRLGDDIDDFCVRCKRVMNHAVVSVLNGAAAKVRCRTCHSDHDFRNEQPPPPKVDPRKQALFNEVLKKVDPAAAPVDGHEHLEVVEVGEAIDAVEALDAIEAIDAAEVVPVPESAPQVEAETIAAKPKPKGRGKKSGS